MTSDRIAQGDAREVEGAGVGHNCNTEETALGERHGQSSADVAAPANQKGDRHD